MSRAVVVSRIAQREVGRLGVMAVWGRGWAWGSVVAVLLTLSLVLAGEGVPDGLDPTSGGGTVTTDFGGDDIAGALVLQPDGKLVAAGYSSDVSGQHADFALARYRPGGHLDPIFGTGGVVTTDFGGREFAGPLVLQPDGKLVLAGCSAHAQFPGCVDFMLVRYLSDGSLDATFGTGGRVTTDFTDRDAGVSALVL